MLLCDFMQIKTDILKQILWHWNFNTVSLYCNLCTICAIFERLHFTGECVNILKVGCESWTLRKNEEARVNAFDIKGMRKILQVSWTAKKTNKWVFNKAGVKKELLDTVKARKLADYGHNMRKQGSCSEQEIMQGTMSGARREEDHVRPKWTTSRRGQDSLFKSQSEW